MQNLQDQTALVVGGGSGIGLGIAKALAAEGCRIVIAGRTQATLEAAAAKLADAPDVFVKTCDAADRSQVSELIAWTTENVGPTDILVYCAGVNVPQRTFADINPDEFDRVLQINAAGAFNCIHAALPHMRERKSGQIFNVVSLAGVRTLQLAGLPYCASKFAQSSIGTFANLEAMPDGVRVSNIYPGETATEILDKRPVPPTPEQREQMVQPEDIADVVLAIAKLPPRTTVPEVVITPRHMPYV